MNNLYSEIISRDNLLNSAKQIKSKSCIATGIDNIPCKLADTYLVEYMEEIIMSLQQDNYIPAPIKRVIIPKPNGGYRSIGVPTVMDKIIQLSIVKVLTPIYEDIFHPYSYGFRAGKSIHTAITQTKEYLDNGYIHIVQIDLDSFFDTINHDKMMSELFKTIKDKQLLKLIRLYLQSEIIQNGKSLGKSYCGLIQGGNLSPLLANVYLNPLDWELSRQGIRFIRFADDLILFCNSIESATAIKNNICRLIEQKMLLKVNTNKTVITTPTECNILGLQFCIEQNEYKSGVPKKSIERLKAKVNANIDNAVDFNEAKRTINDELVGWYAHYIHADKFLSNREMKSIDNIILEKLYKRFGNGMKIKEFKEQLWQDKKNLFMMKIYKLSDN